MSWWGPQFARGRRRFGKVTVIIIKTKTKIIINTVSRDPREYEGWDYSPVCTYCTVRKEN